MGIHPDDDDWINPAPNRHMKIKSWKALRFFCELTLYCPLMVLIPVGMALATGDLLRRESGQCPINRNKRIRPTLGFRA